MAVLFANSAKSTLAANLSSGATLLAIDEDDAWKFPSPSGGDWFPLTLFDAAGNIEYVKCTGRAAAILTIVRAQEGTTARAFIAGSGVSHRLTAAALQAMRDTQSNALDDAVSTLEDSISEAFNSLSTRVDDIVGAPPTALNSLQKLSDAIGGDDEFATTMAAQIADAARLTTGMFHDERLPVRLWPYGENNVPSDANNAQKSGGYMCNPATTNTPFSDWWYLKVEASSGGDIGQRFTRHSDGAVWTRRYISGAWTLPKRVYETAAEIQSLSQSYASGGISIVPGGTFSLTHGLGQKPKYVTMYAKCLTADLGYSVGDEVEIPNGGIQLGGGIAYGVQLVTGATMITGKFAGTTGPITVLNKSTGGGPSSLTAAYWALYVRAFA